MQNALALTNQRSERVEKFERAFFTALPFLMFACIVFMNSIMPALAANGTGTGDTAYMTNVSNMATQIVTIVGYIFRIIGVIMAVYAIATLIQAFQSNNPDAQARGAQVAIVSIILIFVPTIIKSFNLTSFLSNAN